MPIKTVFFDLDGTLWDYRACSAYAIEVAMTRLEQRCEGYELPEHYANLLNVALLEDVIEGGLRELSQSSYARRFARFSKICGIPEEVSVRELNFHCQSARRFSVRTFLKEDAHETLRRLRNRGVTVGVLTNGTPAVKRQVIESLGLRDVLDYTVLGEAEGFAKPDIRLFHRCMDLAGTKPREALFVGDSFFTDLLGAKRAGARAALICTEKIRIPARIPPPDYAFRNLKSLLAIVKPG